MRKVLVLGGSVFIGKAIANRFIKNGDEVYVLNRGNNPCPKGANQLIADRNNEDMFNKVIGENYFDIVIDGSAYTPLQTKIAIKKLNSSSLKHYIHISTATVYQEDQPMPYKEDESKIGIAKSWGNYSENKYMCEQLLFSEYKESNLPITIVRPFYVYGPENALDRESYVFSRLINNKPIVVPGKGKCKIQFGHVDDLCDAILKISQTNKSIGSAYNVSGEEIVTFEDWINACGKALQIKPNMILINAKEYSLKARDWFPFRDISMYGDISKIKNELGITPKYSLYEGLKETISHYTKQELTEKLNINDVELNLINRIKENDIDDSMSR